ncbi:MAG: trypsin-like serine protease [Deltaproteobacteria bacterium]|nr:trypsin-like serine protease [Deltaproteobacteria bacterium]
MSRLRPLLATLALLALPSACALRVTDDSSYLEEDRGALPPSAPIINGTPATAYPEAVLVNGWRSDGSGWSCSGSMIAPRVVLTAGHCIVGIASAEVVAPNAGKQKAYAESFLTYDWTTTSKYIVADQHDVALIVTSTPIVLGSYPILASKPVSQGTKAINVGRVRNGNVSSSQLYVGAPISLNYGGAWGYPYAYASAEIIQSGDSGGPDFLVGAPVHTIVAVNSGGGGGFQLLARVDLVYDWIQARLAEVAVPAPPTPPPPASTCAHGLCDWGAKLAATCDPCAAKICAVDPYCCETSWDKVCVGEVESVCGGGC